MGIRKGLPCLNLLSFPAYFTNGQTKIKIMFKTVSYHLPKKEVNVMVKGQREEKYLEVLSSPQ